MNGLITKYAIAEKDVFHNRGDGYTLFNEEFSNKGKLRAFITTYPGVSDANNKMHESFEEFWAEAGAAVNGVGDEEGITDFTKKFTALLAAKLEPIGILDSFQCIGVFANWWDHSYTVREYTEIEQAADGKETKVSVKEVIKIKNVFKTISAEGFVSALVSDEKIEQEHFPDELAALKSLEDETESATTEVESYFTSLYTPDEDDAEDSDEEGENGEEKEVKLKEGEKEAFLKSLGDEYLKKYKELKGEVPSQQRIGKKTVELQEKVMPSGGIDC